MKTSIAVSLMLVLITPVLAMADSDGAEAPVTTPVTTPVKEFFGKPVSATWGYYDFADQVHGAYLPLQLYFHNPMGETARLCGQSERLTIFIVEEENAILGSILMSLVAGNNSNILLVNYECVDLKLSSGKYTASFAVIKQIYAGVINNSVELSF